VDDLRRLRDEIGALDRSVLEALNRRFELVRRINEHKQDAGRPVIDAEREAELLRDLSAANAGPLSEQAVQSVFGAVLDVMKQELRRDAPAAPGPAPRPTAPPIRTLAIVGTGLLGSSVGLSARRAGIRVSGWDADGPTLREAEGARALDSAAGSLADAVRDAELVVVAVPVGSLADTTREVLSAAREDATVTDVGSTKRGLAQLDDPRLVPGHPLAGGATGGPARAAADMFDGATWFLTPLASSEPSRVERVEQFVTSLGARPIRLDADTHDRVLALTSHLPHALANLLMQSVAAGGDEALGYAGASLREMTRVAGANASIWADIFVENGDLLADALADLGDRTSEVVRALRDRDRAFFEAWIREAATARAAMLEYAYRTEGRTLNRIRVRVPDKPGVLARITQVLGAAGINIEDFELRHVSPEYGGVLVILVAGNENAALARTLLHREGYSAA
jgi:prephenate dehydrogenase